MWEEKKRVCENHNITPLLASEVPTEDSEISAWLSGDVRKGIVVVIEGGVMVNLIDQPVKEFPFLSLFSLLFQGGNWYWLSNVPSCWFLDRFRSGRV